MNDLSQHCPSHQPVVYCIRVNGHIDERISDWFKGMDIFYECCTEGKAISTLVGSLPSQAALHLLLRRIYNLGFLVLSITRVEQREK